GSERGFSPVRSSVSFIFAGASKRLDVRCQSAVAPGAGTQSSCRGTPYKRRMVLSCEQKTRATLAKLDDFSKFAGLRRLPAAPIASISSEPGTGMPAPGAADFSPEE